MHIAGFLCEFNHFRKSLNFLTHKCTLFFHILFNANRSRYHQQQMTPYRSSVSWQVRWRRRRDMHFIKMRASNPFKHGASHLTELCSLLLQPCNEASRTVQSGMNHPVSVSSCIYYPPLVSRLICWLVHSPQLCPCDHGLETWPLWGISAGVYTISQKGKRYK